MWLGYVKFPNSNDNILTVSENIRANKIIYDSKLANLMINVHKVIDYMIEHSIRNCEYHFMMIIPQNTSLVNSFLEKFRTCSHTANLVYLNNSIYMVKITDTYYLLQEPFSRYLYGLKLGLFAHITYNENINKTIISKVSFVIDNMRHQKIDAFNYHIIIKVSNRNDLDNILHGFSFEDHIIQIVIHQIGKEMYRLTVMIALKEMEVIIEPEYDFTFFGEYTEKRQLLPIPFD